MVSTHSRPKAAGSRACKPDPASAGFQHTAARRRLGRFVNVPQGRLCFNTQPPEGGWCKKRHAVQSIQSFNTQPPEGGWAIGAIPRVGVTVSTHSRPKAAGTISVHLAHRAVVSTHSRPKAAGRRPHAQGREQEFQHTAARRRLGSSADLSDDAFDVSTHSRPKAAGYEVNAVDIALSVSTHSRPKAAGFMGHSYISCSICVSTHSRPKAAGTGNTRTVCMFIKFQHTAARRRLDHERY